MLLPIALKHDEANPRLILMAAMLRRTVIASLVCVFLTPSVGADERLSRGAKPAVGSVDLPRPGIPARPSLADFGHRREAADIDFVAALTFASEGWEGVYLQDEREGLFVDAPLPIRRGLANESMGSLVRANGNYVLTAEGAIRFRLKRVKVLDRGRHLEAIPALIQPGQRNTPLRRSSVVRGVVEETHDFWKKTHIILRVNGESTLQAKIDEKTNATQSRKWVDALVELEGCVIRREPRYLGDSLHTILLMTSQQLKILRPAMPQGSRSPRPVVSIQDVPRTSAAQESVEVTNDVLVQVKGTVTYSDGVSRIMIVEKGRRYLIISKFACEINPGTLIAVEGSVAWNHHKDVDVLRSRAIRTLGVHDVPEPEDVLPGAVMTRINPPPQVRMQGRIVRNQFSAKTCTLHLNNGDENFRASISSKNSDIETIDLYLKRGSWVELIGTPIRHGYSDPESGTSYVNLMVASPDMVKVIEQTMLISRTQLVLGVAALTAVFAAILAWTYSLRRQVDFRTRSLMDLTKRMHTAFDAMQEGILITDSQGRLVQANRRFHEIFGIENGANEAPQFPLNHLREKFASANVTQRLQGCLELPKQDSFPTHMVVNDTPTYLHVYCGPITASNGAPGGQLFVFEDITEQNELQANLAQAQKMEAVGRLSGGIAHDFNNLLSVIASSLTTIGKNVDAAEKQKLHAANTAVDRAAGLTQQLLGFARRSRLQRRVVPVQTITDNVEDLLQSIIAAPVVFRTLGYGQDLHVNVDVNRIEQVLINLCLNAYDEVDKFVGEIEIITGQCLHADCGSCACIVVRDNGPGVPPEIQNQIFEPFFTTKDVSRGTGLGLSVAQGVIEQHGGRIDFKTEAGAGTEFRIVLPMEDVPARLDSGPSSLESSSRPLRILLVDDDQLVRDSVENMLIQRSHSVVIAENGMQAIHQLAIDHEFDLILLDLMMPEMSGWATYQEIKSAWPDHHVVFCSGYSEELNQNTISGEEPVPEVIMKPFRSGELDRVLERVSRIPSTSSVLAPLDSKSTVA